MRSGCGPPTTTGRSARRSCRRRGAHRRSAPRAAAEEGARRPAPRGPSPPRAGRAAAEEEQPLARHPVAALLDELLERLLLRRVGGRRVVLLELLGHDEPVRDQDERRDEPAPERAHSWILRPMTVQTPTRAAPATSQATSPSGTGPMWPSPQPPRSSGCFAHST